MPNEPRPRINNRKAWLMIAFLPLLIAFMFLTEGLYPRNFAPYVMLAFFAVYCVFGYILVISDSSPRP